MRKTKKKLLLLAMPIVASLLIFVTIISVVQTAEQQIATILSGLGDQILLQCEGTYDDTSCSMHIWSIDGLIDTATSASGTNVSSNRKIANGHYVGQATSGEKGLRNNKAGDKSGNEVCTSKWYHNSSFGNWNYVVRCKDPNKAAIMAQQMEYCCENNHIGYDQADRKTLYKAAAKVGFDCQKISTDCETTCTEVLVVCAAAAGIKIKNADKKTIYCGNIIAYLRQTNAFEFYTDPSYTRSYKKLKRGDFIINTRHHSCMYLSGSTDGNTSITTINPGDQGSTALDPSVDITITVNRSSNSYKFDLLKKDVMAGGNLNATATIYDGQFKLSGTLGEGSIELTGTADSGVIKGSGTLVLGLLAIGSDSLTDGKATYVGTDDTETPLSTKIIPITKKWNNKNNPYYSGYGGRCEAWCNSIYKSAGLGYPGCCCASSHAKKSAHKDGAIPKGALIFSGQKPDGTMYENGHRSTAYCNTCRHWAGHVAIYVGDGMVAGSQIPYYMSVDSWIDMFGYGGWGTG